MSHRDDINELYRSEKYFIKDVLRNGKSVLDIGCATGGFSRIVKKYNNSLSYTGVDISSVMIDKAKKRFPKERFYLIDGQRLNFPDKTFDICLCFGVLHMTERWKYLLSEAWRVCKNTLLFDLRIVEKNGICNSKISYQNLEFNDDCDGISKVPYVIVSLNEIFKYFKKFKPKIKSLKAYGYWHPISKMTISPYKTVSMSVFCLEKTGTSGNIDWRLPLKIDNKLKQQLFQKS